jgi:hypothetical protein
MIAMISFLIIIKLTSLCYLDFNSKRILLLYSALMMLSGAISLKRIIKEPTAIKIFELIYLVSSLIFIDSFIIALFTQIQLAKFIATIILIIDGIILLCLWIKKNISLIFN